MDGTTGGATSGVFKYRLNGQQGKFAIGRYPDLTLKRTREMRDKPVLQVAEGKSHPARLTKTSHCARYPRAARGVVSGIESPARESHKSIAAAVLSSILQCTA